MEGGGVPATQRPQKPVITVVAIIDVNGIKSTTWVVLNAVKEGQTFEFQDGDNTSISDHRGLLDIQIGAYFTYVNCSCMNERPGLMYQ